MKKLIKEILKIATVGFFIICAYIVGTAQAKMITEKHTVTETKEVIPDGYIPLDQCIPLEDVACCYVNENDYICFELKDTRYQLDDPQNRSYVEIQETIEQN